MLKKSENPTVTELNNSHRDRTISLGEISVVLKDGKRFCAWCATTELSGSKLKKYCSDSCRDSVMAWGYPQKENGLAALLGRQQYRCNACQYDWNPLADSLIGKFGIPKALDRFTQFNYRLVKILKNRSPKGTKPEVDHIVPVSKGGQSIGLENVQAICFSCHKAKSKVDNSGPRKKKA